MENGWETTNIISVSAKEKTAADARTRLTPWPIAISSTSARPAARTAGSGAVFQRATNGAETGPIKALIGNGTIPLGGLGGRLIGVAVAVAISRRDQRLRERGEIANSIGVAVLASFPVAQPSGAAKSSGCWRSTSREPRTPGSCGAPPSSRKRSWPRGRQPVGHGPVAGLRSPGPRAWSPAGRLRRRPGDPHRPGRRPSARCEGHGHTANGLRAAPRWAPSPERPGHLQLAVCDADADRPAAGRDAGRGGHGGRWPDPRVPATMRTTATVLGVSAGAATAEELARVAISAVSGGREITGILVADPDSDDTTTGRLQQLVRRPARAMPTRVTRIATEIRR